MNLLLIKRTPTALWLILIFVLFISFFLATQTELRAQETETEYQLLAPLPGTITSGGGEDEPAKTRAVEYIQGLFRLLIGVAGALAVVMIIIGGIQYMSTDAFSGKSSAKDTIQNALWGLALAAGAWIILASISKSLVEFNLNIEQVDRIETSTPRTPVPSVVIPGPSMGSAWSDDSSVRASLLNDNITTNRGSNCQTIGERNCTSLYGMSQNVINNVKSLAEACNCAIIITGGTEYWLHGNRSTELDLNTTAHRPGGNVVDLSLHTGVSNHIRSQGQRTTSSSCAPGVEKYTLNGATYVNEGTHWHVCY